MQFPPRLSGRALQGIVRLSRTIAGKGGKMGVFSESLFAFLARNARSATGWFGIPPDQVVELGMQIDL